MAREVEQQLERILAGDEEAAGWLYDSFAPGLARRLSRRYPDLATEVEDLVHDVFVLFLRNDAGLLRDFLDRHRASSPGRSALERRLWDLACGLASNRRRTVRHRRVVTLDDRERPDRSPGAERTALDRDQLRRLDACLRSGNERVYLYFKLRYRDGLSPEEISRITGWSRKATYKLKQALNRAVADCLESLGWGEP